MNQTAKGATLRVASANLFGHRHAWRAGSGPVVYGEFTTDEWRMFWNMREVMKARDAARVELERVAKGSPGDPRAVTLLQLLAAEHEATKALREIWDALEPWPTLEQLAQMEATLGVVST